MRSSVDEEVVGNTFRCFRNPKANHCLDVPKTLLNNRDFNYQPTSTGVSFLAGFLVAINSIQVICWSYPNHLQGPTASKYLTTPPSSCIGHAAFPGAWALVAKNPWKVPISPWDIFPYVNSLYIASSEQTSLVNLIHI